MRIVLCVIPFVGPERWIRALSAISRRVLSLNRMKSVKIYLLAVCLLLCVAIGLGIYVWYVVQEYNRDITNPESIIPETEIIVPKEVPSE
jgi:ABC-type Fe3+ transport system permease subunit